MVSSARGAASEIGDVAKGEGRERESEREERGERLIGLFIQVEHHTKDLQYNDESGTQYNIYTRSCLYFSPSYTSVLQSS